MTAAPKADGHDNRAAQAATVLQPIEEPLNQDPNCYEGLRNLTMAKNKAVMIASGLTAVAQQVRAHD